MAAYYFHALVEAKWCPSSKKACFEGAVGEVQGAINTQFNFHVVPVTERTRC